MCDKNSSDKVKEKEPLISDNYQVVGDVDELIFPDDEAYYISER